ncbi:MAG: acyl-CoA dehydratase activase [Spirochaetia bacterium]|nr:acyl-CoA dehydratase activase [Spirochaetia bacterium]
MEENKYYLGLDVGSTTVKGILMLEGEGALKTIWKCYERHETRQAEKVHEFLKELEVLYPHIFYSGSKRLDVFITGSGGNTIKNQLGAHYYQEVSSVSSAVEKLYPETRAVIELGGQDAKIIIYREDKVTGEKKKLMTMNDKCAGGTGAVIDKIACKLQLSKEEISKIQYKNTKLHPVAGKCGVFAETDINGLQKQGIGSDELMASLFEAIVQQNLSVLTRGNTLLPRVLLLGGPNFFLPGLQDSWKHNLLNIWQDRNINLSSFDGIDDMVIIPDDANYFAAMGVVFQGIKDKLTRSSLEYRGTRFLQEYIANRENMLSNGGQPFFINGEKEKFIQKYIPAPWIPPAHNEKKIKAYIGLDSGSTSTKGVLLSERGEVLAYSYMLSRGNPIEDSKNILANLKNEIEQSGAELEILGVGTTGYGKDILKDVLQADVAVVETVAHTLAARFYYPQADVIVDVGGQDIKLIILKDGIVKDFKLNTQCSAGNGYFLQNTAETFGYKVEDFAEIAFGAPRKAEFGYGCAVFLQTDIVDFQRQGWEGPEIMAGLAEVLPKNIWQYVAGISNLELLGSTFVLQGGTQKNYAAVKSQVDYIIKKFRNSEKTPEIFIHKFTSVCGAIGAALEAIDLGIDESTFTGFEEVSQIQYSYLHNESTRCDFCRNKCIRTFIDLDHSGKKRRLILAPCEKGRFEAISEVRKVQKEMNRLREQNPNLVHYSSKKVWESCLNSIRGYLRFLNNANYGHSNFIFHTKNRILSKRKKIRLGFPRVLNHYVLQPFLNAYFETLGFNYQNFYFSSFTDEEMYKKGSKRGSVDPCFPAKVALSHVTSLLTDYGDKLDYIIFPMVGSFPADIDQTIDERACPTVTGAPEMVYSALTKEEDLFGKKGIEFLKPFLSFGNYGTLEKQIYREFSQKFHIGEYENKIAVRAGFHALKKYKHNLSKMGKKLIETVVKEKRLALVLLGRPYHSDPGINHGIMDLFIERGYPVMPISAIPMDKHFLSEYFTEDEIFSGEASGIDDVWKNSFSANSSQKIWAAKFIARHPNLIPVELSSFKCGHDSTLYSTIERIFEHASKPFFSFKDIDENNPAGSIKIRIETMDYFLKKHVLEMKRGKESSHSLFREKKLA